MPRGDSGRRRQAHDPPKHDPPSSRNNSQYPPRSKASPRYDDDNSDDDTPRSHRQPTSARGHSRESSRERHDSRQPTSARGHSRESSRENNAVRRGSDSSSGSVDRPPSRHQPTSARGHSRESSRERHDSREPTSARGHSRESSRENNAVRRGSDSSSGSVDRPSGKGNSKYEGENSTEITPRVVQEVGSHARRDSGSKTIRQKALMNSNGRIKRNSGDPNAMKTSASTASMRPGDRDRDREGDSEDRRPVTSAEKRTRNIHNSSNSRHEASRNPDERVIRQVQADVYSESQSYYDEHGTGFNDRGEEDGSWMCLKPSCQAVSLDTSITWCEKCATVRGASGQRGDNVRLSMNR